jgi:hypothetical protein
VPWQKLRDSVEVKLLSQGREVYVLAKSQGRREKETAIRRKQTGPAPAHPAHAAPHPQRPWKRDTLLHKLGAAHKEAGRAWSFVKITVPKARQPVNRDTFQFELLKDKLRDAQERDGHYLLRGFGAGDQAAPLWERYMQLTEIEAAFKTLKSDLQLRPIRHHVELRIEAHILVCFLAYCLSVTLRKRLQAHAPGLTSAGGAGNPFRHSDAGRSCAAGRWKGTGDAALHPTGSRTSAGLGETGLAVAAPTAAAHPFGRKPPNSPKRPRDELKNVVETFCDRCLANQRLTPPHPPLNHEISVKASTAVFSYGSAYYF